jgi:hypothetical protein
VAKKQTARTPKTITAEEFDRRFDAGEDVSAYIDWKSARRPGREVQRVNVDFPIDMLHDIDQEVARLGITRQAFIKMRIADALATTHAAKKT